MNHNGNIAPCGIDCAKCDIFAATDDPTIAQHISDWFKKEMNKDIDPKDITCAGCREDRDKHWSPDCWILKCCVDDKGLQYCFQCGEFPCDKLVEWSQSDTGYDKALQRLKDMQE